MSEASVGGGATVSALHVYPIKSCAGVDLKAVSFDAQGPLYDRRFMLVDETGGCLSQRELPRMALIAPRLGAMSLSVSAPEMPPLKLAMTLAGAPSSTGKRVPVKLGGTEFLAEDVGEHAASWFSDFLQHRCRLVRAAAGAVRCADPSLAGPGVELAFADRLPIQLCSEASLADLNARLKEHVAMNRFRPTIVVRGVAAFAEDGWREIRVGEVSFDVVEKVAVDAMIGVDPILARAGSEPLATLAGYRGEAGEVHFGQHCIHRSLGSIRVGDSVVVERS